MPAPICVKCQVEMRCERNDMMVNEVLDGSFPSTYWMGDLFECLVCHICIVVGFGRSMAAETAAEIGFDTTTSITFAYSPEQREQYADQFKKRSEAVDVLHHSV